MTYQNGKSFLKRYELNLFVVNFCVLLLPAWYKKHVGWKIGRNLIVMYVGLNNRVGWKNAESLTIVLWYLEEWPFFMKNLNNFWIGCSLEKNLKFHFMQTWKMSKNWRFLLKRQKTRNAHIFWPRPNFSMKFSEMYGKVQCLIYVI